MHPRLEQIVNAERRIELLNGRVQVGGTQAMTRLVLQQLLAQASLAELRDLGRSGWHGAAQLAFEMPPLPVGSFDHRRHYSLLQRVSLPFFEVLAGSALVTHSRDIAVRLGDSVLTPDVFIGHKAMMHDYYLEGSPLLALEVIDPNNPREELERLGHYLASATPEVWWLEPKRGCLRQFTLKGNRYRVQTYTSGWVESFAVAGLSICLGEAWQPGWRPPLKVRYRGKENERPGMPLSGSPVPPDELIDADFKVVLQEVLGTFSSPADEPAAGGYPADLSFAPRISLEPQRVSFEAFISWTTEAKFEVMDDRLVIGSEQGTHELLGLLLLSIGLIEAYSLLGAEAQTTLRDIN